MLTVEYRSTVCPHCGSAKSRITEAWMRGWYRSRRHVCGRCGAVYTSRQKIMREAAASATRQQ